MNAKDIEKLIEASKTGIISLDIAAKLLPNLPEWDEFKVRKKYKKRKKKKEEILRCMKF